MPPNDPIKKEEVVFFPGLNGLRFMAALAVIITHIELLKGTFGFTHHWNNIFIFNLGGLGVYFFFVLSGFLITYLLLKEKQKFAQISVKKFYLRRILRIWPLYYIMLVLGFFVLPHFQSLHITYLQSAFEKNFGRELLLYILILPNAAFAFFAATPHIGHLWSIGVEEQFYIAWPFVVSKSKNILRALLLIIAFIIVVKMLMLLLSHLYSASEVVMGLKQLIAMSKFECMAIGGIGAYYLHVRHQGFLKVVMHPQALNLSLLAIPLLVYFTPEVLQDGVHMVFSVVFLIVIMNITSNKKTLLNLNHKSLSYLGKISYGIYMYHFVIVAIVLAVARSLHFNWSPLLFNSAVYTTVIALTIGVSALSYHLIEYRFIRLKAQFTGILSGEQEASKNQPFPVHKMGDSSAK